MNRLLNIVDLVPTIAELAGAQMTADYEADGEVILDALRGATHRNSRAMFWHHPGRGSGVRRWRSGARTGSCWSTRTAAGCELYDLAGGMSGRSRKVACRRIMPEMHCGNCSPRVERWHEARPQVRRSGRVPPGGRSRDRIGRSENALFRSPTCRSAPRYSITKSASSSSIRRLPCIVVIQSVPGDFSKT